MSHHVVIGGGICGLLAACLLRRRHPGAKITLLERAPQLGGLLAGTDYPEAGLGFDQGTHILQETGNAEIDGIIRDAIPPEQLHYPSGETRDLAGAVFRNRLQLHSPYPDLRSHPKRDDLLESLRQHLSGPEFRPELQRTSSLTDACRQRFGAQCADQIVIPLLSNLYHIPAADLSVFALLLPGLGRLVFTDEQEWLKHADWSPWRATVAYPDQFHLPAAYRHSRRFYTALNGGASGVIAAMERHLLSEGVTIFRNTEKLDFNTTKMTIAHGGPERADTVINADSLFVSTGIFGAAALLGLRPADYGAEPPMLHRVVHLALDRPVDFPLFYFYGFDTEDPFYRVTNYRAFSGVPDDRRITIEVLARPELPDADLPTLIMTRLRTIGFLQKEVCVFSRVKRLARGFPRPTLRNAKAITALRCKVERILPTMALISGAGAADALFFTNETLLHSHYLIQKTQPTTQT